MAERGLELRAALARRQYWMEELSSARQRGDKAAEARAAQFLAEYDALIAEIERQRAS